MLGYSERMSILAHLIILNLSVTLHKTSKLAFIGCYNVQLESYCMTVTASVCSLSWNDDVRACSLMVSVPYPLRKFRLISSFSYLWLWHISVLASYHTLSVEYFCVQFMHFCIFLLFLRAVSCHFSSCIHAWFYYSSFCIHTGFDFFFVRANLNHISNKDSEFKTFQDENVENTEITRFRDIHCQIFS